MRFAPTNTSRHITSIYHGTTSAANAPCTRHECVNAGFADFVQAKVFEEVEFCASCMEAQNNRRRARSSSMVKAASEFFKEYAKVKTIGQGSYGKAILCEHRDTLLKCVVKQISVPDRKVR